MDAINIGELIYDKLHSLVGDRVYPMVAENSTSFPFIIYSRSATMQRCKDGYYDQQVSLEVKVVSDTYNGVVEIASSVWNELSLSAYNAGQSMVDSHLESVDESYESDSYVQTMNFAISIY